MRRSTLVLTLSALLAPASLPSRAARAEPPPKGTEAAAPAVAPEEEDDGADEQAAARLQLAGSYHGVAPGSDTLPPRAPKLPVKGPVRMTFPGFQIRDGVPTVFFQLTGPVAWSVSAAHDKLVYTLTSTTVPLTNNRRPLNVSEFKTAVKAVEAKQHGRDVEVTIRLNKKVTHKERTETAAGGYKFLVIELQSF
jgi:hypothetical protein